MDPAPRSSPAVPHASSEENYALQAETTPHFVCWNIDASRDREFFDRNLSIHGDFGLSLAVQAETISSAQNAGFSLLRFGGTGNDYLTYAGFDNTSCPTYALDHECLNVTWWTNLMEFTRAAHAKMVFGVSMNTPLKKPDNLTSTPAPFTPWDPTNARALLTWTINHGFDDLLYAFELGNEQNNEFTAQQIAQNIGILYKLTVELWPDETKRPLLVGPDAHSFTESAGKKDARYRSYYFAFIRFSKTVCSLLTLILFFRLLGWMSDYLAAVTAAGTPLHAVTHHEYIEIDFRYVSFAPLTIFYAI